MIPYFALPRKVCHRPFGAGEALNAAFWCWKTAVFIWLSPVQIPGQTRGRTPGQTGTVLRVLAAYQKVTIAAIIKSGMAATFTQSQPKKWMNAPDDSDPMATTV
jgi:hypothetical protein